MNRSTPGLPVHHQLPEFESVMPSSHLILCRPLLLLPPIPPSIRVLSNESTLRMRWPKYWSFSFSIIHSKEHPGLISLLCIHKVWILASKFGFHWSTREQFWNYLMHINKHIVDGESQYSPSQGKELNKKGVNQVWVWTQDHTHTHIHTKWETQKYTHVCGMLRSHA